MDYLLSNKLIEFADPLWLKMKKESIFITGGTGLFGRWFLYNLIDANDRLGLDVSVTILTRDAGRFIQKFPEFSRCSVINMIEGDVTSFEFPKNKFNKVIHMATTSAHETFDGEDQIKKFHTLVNGTERVMKFVVESGAKKVLFTSSGVAYGSIPVGMKKIPESYMGGADTTLPSSALGQGKRAAEFICAYYADKYGFEYSVARCFSFVGYGMPLNIHYAVGNFIYDALYNDVIEVKGDGSPIRSYLHLGDLVIWLLTLLTVAPSARIYNVGSDYGISIMQLAKIIRDKVCPDKALVVKGESEKNISNIESRDCYVPSIDRAREELGLDCWTSLDNSIDIMVNALRSNGDV